MKQFYILFSFLFSLNAFTQTSSNPCISSSSKHIVILGSSTAAGSGPTSPDSAWVNRYRTFLQSINPNNQVTNLAVGGFTTYRVMPSSFVPPSNRPSPNTARNITQALSLSPDAIIVNLPSNDVANGFSVIEQMQNLHTIAGQASNAGIPIWICTTQPVTNFNAAQNVKQLQVRDSIQAAFGAFSINFWTPFADSNNNLFPVFDSGDGTHMSDTAHRVLNEKVKAANLLGYLYDTLSTVDHILTDFQSAAFHPCGDSITEVTGLATNLGPTSFIDLPYEIQIEEMNSGSLITLIDTLFGGIQTCAAETISFNLNTAIGGSWQIKSYLFPSGDFTTLNDTANIIIINTLGYPSLSPVNDTVCVDEDATLKALSSNLLDTVFWYQQASGGSIVQGGIEYQIHSDSLPAVKYASAVRGDLFLKESVATTTISSTNFNGIMFDIVADTSLTIDSLSMKMESTGLQGVVAYYKMGSHIGYESQPTSWQIWGVDAVNNPAPGSFPTINLPELNMNAGDTIGVYLHMQLGSSDLSYRWSTSFSNYTDGRLSVISGTGVSATFGNSFSPRHFAGEVFYHYGFEENGFCNTPRIPVYAEVSNPSIDLGGDTSITAQDTLVLSGGTFTSYFWNTGSTADSLLVDSNTFGTGPNIYWIEVGNEHGCIAGDTILINILPTPPSNDSTGTGIENALLAGLDVKIYPNPFFNELHLDFQNGLADWISIHNLNGQEVYRNKPSSNRMVIAPNLEAGQYILLVESGNQVRRINMQATNR